MGVKHEEDYWAHFGPYPTNYHELVIGWVEKNFDEPRNVTVSSPVRVQFPKGLLNNSDNVYGWRAGVGFEPKGTFDAYAPRQYHHLYMRDGGIVNTIAGIANTIANNMEQPRERGIAQAPYSQ
jgi:hypothetical protein